jgi:dienelactone hydrolase
METSSQALPAIDARYHTVRHGDLHFAFPHYATLAEWEQRAAWLREHILVVQGLWPLPERCPLNAHILGRIEYDDYTLEKVYFESWPGFYCTGNLFRPRTHAGRVPAILNPHGHWERGRLAHEPNGSIRARCITFARMGMVAFAYDMVGYHDSLQVPKHRFASARGALWGLTPMALQTWNSLRAVDFLESLEDVDPARIGCTGESGGGTQTFMLTAVEPRIQVIAPVNMISAHMQGGCVCENTPGLRVDTYNVEIGALAAPRPMLMVSATGDWTVNTPTVEYPAVRSVYQLYGADDKLAWTQVDAPHNYNAASRAHVYRWFARWFLGDESLGIDAERDFVVEPDERMRVFPAGKLPSGALTSAGVERAIVGAAQQRLDALLPTRPASLQQLREVATPRLTHILCASAPAPEDVLAEPGEERSGEWGQARDLALGRRGKGERIHATLYQGTGEATGPMALVVHGAGRAGVMDGFGGPGEKVRALLGAGYSVLAIDPVYTGAVPADALPTRDLDWFWATFNQPLLGARVQDVLTALAYAAAQPGLTSVTLLGLGSGGAWALLAAALSPIAAQVCVDVQAMALDDDGVYLDGLYAPLLRAYGDLRVASALVAPRALLLTNTARRFSLRWARAAYTAAGVLNRLSESPEPLDNKALLAWLGTVRG